MVRRIVQEVDREKLKCFGINLGWESWTVGAGRIRALEGERHYNIPWCLTFRLGGQPWALGAEDYRALLLQGQELGICSYFFLRKSPAPTLGFSRSWPSSSAAARFSCSFPGGPQGASPHGGLPVRQSDALAPDGRGHMARPDSRLRSDGCLHGLYRTYTCEEDAADITSGGWLNALGGGRGPAIFYVPPGLPSVRPGGGPALCPGCQDCSELLLFPCGSTSPTCCWWTTSSPMSLLPLRRAGRHRLQGAGPGARRSWTPLRSSTLAEVLERFFPWAS